MQPCIPLDFFSKSAQCWLMFSSLSTIPPMSFSAELRWVTHRNAAQGPCSVKGVSVSITGWVIVWCRAKALKGAQTLQKDIVQGIVELSEAHPRISKERPKCGRMGWVHLDGGGSRMEREKENHGLMWKFRLERMPKGPKWSLLL